MCLYYSIQKVLRQQNIYVGNYLKHAETLPYCSSFDKLYVIYLFSHHLIVKRTHP